MTRNSADKEGLKKKTSKNSEKSFFIRPIRVIRVQKSF
jgi:hypothetical protein